MYEARGHVAIRNSFVVTETNAPTNMIVDRFLESEIDLISGMLPICQSYDKMIGEINNRALNEAR